MNRILLVDSNVHTCLTLTQLLRALGHDVHVARSGAAAIDHLGANPADLVIVNVMMPQLDGWQLLAWIRSQPGIAGIPVIAHGITSEAQAKSALRMGATDYWPEGACTFSSICDSLEHHLGRQLTAAA